MIDVSRKYILNLYSLFERDPSAKEKWVEENPRRFSYAQNLKCKVSFDDHLLAAQLLFSLFVERRTGDTIKVSNKLPEFLRDLKELESTAFICEFSINKLVYHHFVIQKTAASIFYLYQSHPPFYTINECLKDKDKDPLSFEALSTQLSLLSGPSINRSYTARLVKSLFHIEIDAPPLYPSYFNYIKCPYRPFEALIIDPIVNRLKISYVRFFITISLIATIYLVIRYFKQMEPYKYILDVKYNLK